MQLLFFFFLSTLTPCPWLKDLPSVLYFSFKGPIHPKLPQNENPRWRTQACERTRVRASTVPLFFLFLLFSFLFDTLPLARGIVFGTLFLVQRSNRAKTTPKRKSKMEDTGMREGPSSSLGECNYFFSFFFPPPNLAPSSRIYLRYFILLS